MSNPNVTTFARSYVVLSETVTLSADVTTGSVVTHGGDLASTATASEAMGVVMRAGSATEPIEVVTLGYVPVRVNATPAIVPGDYLVPANGGVLTKATTGQHAFARARTATTAIINPTTGQPENFVLAAVGYNLGVAP